MKSSPSSASQVFFYVFPTKLECLFNDICSAGVPMSLMGAGVWLDSSAMQWFGFIIGMLWLISRSSSANNRYRVSPQDAADILASKYGVTGRKAAP